MYSAGGLVLGAILGSFLATLVVRWPQSASVVSGRSRCDHCGRAVAYRDLVPILSYAALRSKARCCGGRIDGLHPATELGAAVIGAVSFGLFGPLGLLTAVLGWTLLVLALLDARHLWLPDRLTGFLAVAGLIAALVSPTPSAISRMIGMVAGWAILSLIAALYARTRGRSGMGGGDPKLLGAIGAWTGWAALPLVLLAAASIGIVFALLAKIAGREINAATQLPLGTFLAAAAWPIWLYLQWIAETGGYSLFLP